MKIRLFGGLQIQNDQQVIQIARLRERILLAYLLLHAQIPYTRERLIELLWPESESERSGRNFANVLYRLQQIVGKDWFISEGSTLMLQLPSHVTVDTVEFERLRRIATLDALNEAATLYSHEQLLPPPNLLPDLSDEWLLPIQTYYHECFLTVLQQLAGRYEEEHQFESANTCYQRLRLNDPLNEEAYAGGMRTFARLGRLAEAMETYRQLEDVLQQELNTKPSNALRALRDTLQRTPAYVEPLLSSNHSSAQGQKQSSVVAHNLPKPLTRLIGRKRELDQIGRLLANQRLITLTGAGGSGKTRLAIECGHQLADTFEHGACWLDLSPVTDESLLAQTLFQALGGTISANTSVLQQVTDSLRTKQILLIVDNCEHLIQGCAQLVETLLQNCPEVQVLATSREALGVSGEVIWLAPTLAVPGEGEKFRSVAPAPMLIADLLTFPAIQLFVERARAVRSEFQLTAENAPTVVEICQRLDGIPLAIELAAARVKALSVAQIAERLLDRFKLLVNQQRNVLPRQQTLHALIDWSYTLLLEAERHLLRQLAVFAGSFSLETAEAICGEETLEWLTRLVDKSMVQFFERRGTSRYRLFETIRQYAQQKLAESGEDVCIRNLHLAYYLHLAETAASHLSTPQHERWVNDLESEQDNLRAALQWSLAQAQLLTSLRLVNALSAFWLACGIYIEARTWIKQVLSLATSIPPDSEQNSEQNNEQNNEIRTLLARTMAHAGRFALHQADYSNAVSLLNDSLELSTLLADQQTVMRTLNTLGNVYIEQRCYTQAQECYGKSLVLAEAMQHPTRMAVALNNLGIVTHEQGKLLEARSFYARSLDLYRQLGDLHGSTNAMIGLGRVATSLQDYASAKAYFDESLVISRQLGNKRIAALALSNLGDVLRLGQQWDQAVEHLQESITLALELGNLRLAAQFLVGLAVAKAGLQKYEMALCMIAVASSQLTKLATHLDAPEQADFDSLLAHLHSILAPDLLKTLWQQAQEMEIEQVVRGVSGTTWQK